MSDRDDDKSPNADLPKRLVSNHANQPSPEDVREMKANLTGFFAVLREWREKEKARPPPGKRQTTVQRTPQPMLLGELNQLPNKT